MKKFEVNNNLSKIRVVISVLFSNLLVLLLITSCNYLGIGGGQETPSAFSNFRILAPPDNVKVLVNSPVQIQSAHPGGNISRVELWVREPQAEKDKLLRSDVPINQVVLQEWSPRELGTYVITVRTYSTNNEKISELTRSIQVVDAVAVSVEAVEQAGKPGPEPTKPVPPTPTPVGPAQVEVSEASIAVVATATPQPTATPVPRYPPPPPVPGVPPGPTQAELPKLAPPVCDAAEFVDVYAADPNRRITITEPDDVPAKTVGGTIVHRAWRLRNTGTCTWGPGYELAFYGGRSMGSGGVAFESIFPAEPGRRNTIVDRNRLIVPEGKPNQVAVVELLLTVPVTPGIHQSYWRMRNPQGVYFGPIIGVTLEVVRACQFGIYGAPVINKFEILGVGDVFRPENPVNVQAEFGQVVTLDWDIINASSFDVILEDPTGTVSALSNTDPKGRAQFRASELGEYTITIYADNGPCTASADVKVDVVPPENQQFDLDIILASTSTSTSTSAKVSTSPTLEMGNIIARWRHFDKDADRFTLIAQLYTSTFGLQCPYVKSIFGWQGYCSRGWGDWSAVSGKRVVIDVGGQGDAQGAATVTNVESNLCPDPSSYNPAEERFGIRYVMRAEKNGVAAKPEFSNSVDTICGTSPTGSELPVEIQGGFSP